MRLVNTPGSSLLATLQTAAIVLAFAAASATAAHADTVITQGNTQVYSTTMLGPSELTGPVYVTVGWTTGSSAYSNVSISALLAGGDGTNYVDAYLTTAAGPGATNATLVSEQTVVFSYLPAYSTINLFSGLTLDANTTYYLTLAPESTNYIIWGVDNAQPAPTVGPGVTEIGATYCGLTDCALYAPGSTATATTDDPIYSVTGTAFSPTVTPEPASLPLLATGLGMVGLLKRRFVRKG